MAVPEQCHWAGPLQRPSLELGVDAEVAGGAVAKAEGAAVAVEL